MLKPTAKRRRSKAQIKEDKQREANKDREIARKMEMFQKQQQELEMLRQQTQDLSNELSNAHQFKSTMEEAGLIKIDQQSQIHPVVDPNEQLQIREEKERASKQKMQGQASSLIQNADLVSQHSFHSVQEEGDQIIEDENLSNND